MGFIGLIGFIGYIEFLGLVGRGVYGLVHVDPLVLHLGAHILHGGGGGGGSNPHEAWV